MDPNLGEIACPQCHSASQPADTGSDRWQCPSCQALFYLRRCAACEKVSHVTFPHGWNRPWDCAWCHEVNTGFTQNRDSAAATVADYMATAPKSRPAAPPPQPTAPPPQPAALPQAARPPEQAAHPPQEHVGPDELRDGDSWFPLADGVHEPSRHILRRSVAIAASVAGVVGVAVIALALLGGGRTSLSDAKTARGDPASQHAVHVTAGSVSAVRLKAPPGALTIVNAADDEVTLTGQLTWSGHTPVTVARLDRTTRVLTVSYVCASASPCSGTLQLSVPGSTSTTLVLTSGQVSVSGLAGPLSITASHVNVTATGLRSPDLVAVIVSGQLAASFAAAPARVGVTLTSAQATVRLPASATYQVNQQIVSGNLKVGVPRSSGAGHVVTARITAGGLTLLPT